MQSFLSQYINPNSLYINKDSKWLWLRIHKTAGTSMYDAFLKDYCLNIAKGNQRSEAIKWINSTTDQELENYTVWTCVRNPYDRFCSMAAMFKVEPNRFAKEFKHFQRTNRVISRHTQKQHLFTHYQGKCMANHVLRFENLQPDFDALCQTLNLPQFTLPHLNTSQRTSWKEALDDKAIAFVNREFEEDFDLFNYKMV